MMLRKISDWFSRYIWGEEEIEVGSLWVFRGDLSENPFAQKSKVDVYKVVEKKFGNGKGKSEEFILLSLEKYQSGIKSMSEVVFRHTYLPYNDETIEYWNLK